MISQAPRILEGVGLALHYGIDPIALLTSDDPLLVGVLNEVVEHAEDARSRDRRELAVAIVNAMAESEKKGS
jgi:hypothetical protein